MLLRFGISNFGSIREYQEFSLVASSLKDDGPSLLEVPSFHGKVLPVAMIYGANASGKSTVLKAFNFLRGAVLYSSKTSPTAPIPRVPFALDNSGSDRPTQVDCDFVHNGVRYHFGFVARDDVFEEEWLYSFPEGNRRKLFHRKEGEPISFGKFFKGKNQAIASLTRRNCLFLSSAAQNAHEQATDIFRFFEEMTGGVITAALNAEALANELREGIDNRILHFLRLADTGITGGRVQETPVPEKVNKLIARIKNIAAEELSDFSMKDPQPNVTLSLSHASGENREDVFFDLQSESRGTLRLLKLLRPLFNALDRGGLVFVDEIDASVHTLLSIAVIELFSSTKTNPKGAQLVATTHDTTLLCSKFLRRDQIWFTEKDISGATSLYPLSDLRTRSSDNLEKGYLQGRFGAIPFLGDFSQLLDETAEVP